MITDQTARKITKANEGEHSMTEIYEKSYWNFIQQITMKKRQTYEKQGKYMKKINRNKKKQ